ncbi:metal ABC transporter permease, partial [Pseudomonas aeruginosa]
MDFFETISFANIDCYEIWLASVDTFCILGVSLLFTVVLGLPLCVLLFLTGPLQMFE